MIILPILVLLITVLIQLSLHYKRRESGSAVLKIEDLDNKLNDLKAISYLFPSKNKLLEDDLKRLSSLLFLHQQFIQIRIITPAKIYRFCQDKVCTTSDQPTDLEKFLETDSLSGEQAKKISSISLAGRNFEETNCQNAEVIHLDYLGQRKGSVILLTEQPRPLDDLNVAHLETIGNLIAMLIHRSELGEKLTSAEQLKAVNIQW